MFLGLARFELFIPGSLSLKDKRSSIKSMTERIKSRHNATITEVDPMELWQRADIAVAVLRATKEQAEKSLDMIQTEIERYHEVEITQNIKKIFSKELFEGSWQ